MYIIRLDDASEYEDKKKWERIKKLLNKYEIKPIIGVIPNNKDNSLVKKYEKNENFWNEIKELKENGWIIAMHGFDHKYISNSGGINPIQKRSEFAGIPLKKQKQKIKDGISIFEKNGIYPDVFFAPSHTFDENTIIALKENSNINIISDTIASDVYFKHGMYFIPQQSGKVRKLPFKTVTFCYHPNEMEDCDYKQLEDFIIKNINKFRGTPLDNLKKRKRNIYDIFLEKIYFARRKK